MRLRHRLPRVLAVLFVAGLAACGSDSANRPPVTLPPNSGQTTTTGPVTTAGVTSTTAASTTTTRPPLTTTTLATTTTTRPPVTTTTTRATTTTEPPATATTAGSTTTTTATTTTEPTTTSEAAAAETTTTAPSSSSTSSGDEAGNWLWLLFLLGLIAVIVAVVMNHRKAAALARKSWVGAAGRAVSDGKMLVEELSVGLAVRADSLPALQRRLQAYDASLAALESGAPGEPQSQAVADVRTAVASAATGLDTDLALRIGPPAPTDQQLEMSRAMVVERANEFGTALDRLAVAAQPPPS
jgi:hypothetical protein